MTSFDLSKDFTTIKNNLVEKTKNGLSNKKYILLHFDFREHFIDHFNMDLYKNRDEYSLVSPKKKDLIEYIY